MCRRIKLARFSHCLLNDQCSMTVTITVRRTAVRKTVVSQHHGVKLRVVPEILRTTQQYVIEGFKGGPHYVKRCYNLSDNRISIYSILISIQSVPEIWISIRYPIIDRCHRFECWCE